MFMPRGIKARASEVDKNLRTGNSTPETRAARQFFPQYPGRATPRLCLH
jgi:hypothetical protein